VHTRRVTTTDRGLEPLDESECPQLVQRCCVGRLASTLAGAPVVLPANYALSGSSVVFRTANGAKLRAAREHQVAAFEIDHIDPVFHRDWSVLGLGALTEVTDPLELAAHGRSAGTTMGQGHARPLAPPPGPGLMEPADLRRLVLSPPELAARTGPPSSEGTHVAFSRSAWI